MTKQPGPIICKQVKTNGERCRAAVTEGSPFCFFHSPEKADARRSAQRAGGVARTRGSVTMKDATVECPLETAADGLALLGAVTQLLLQGKLEPKRATAVGYLVNIFFRGFSVHNLETRLALLEDVVKNQTAESVIPSAVDSSEQFDFERPSEEEGSDDESDQ